jgi:phage pi2 protein 07
MNFNVGDLVRLDKFKVEGKVIQILSDSVLVEHMIIQEGRSKIVNQWYFRDLVTDVKETEEVKVDVLPVKPKKNRVNKKGKKAISVEFGIIPNPNK